MDKQQALAEIRQQLSEILAIDEAQIAEDALIIDDLGASSIEVVQLYVYFQEKGIVLSDSLDLYEPVTVGQMADHVVSASQQ